MPGPVSADAHLDRRSASAAIARSDTPPSGRELHRVASRLRNTCSSRRASPRTHARESAETSRWTPPAAATGIIDSITPCSTTRMSTSYISSAMRPDCRREKSSRSSTRLAWRVAFSRDRMERARGAVPIHDALLQHRGPSEDRVERRPQLVRHDRRRARPCRDWRGRRRRARRWPFRRAARARAPGRSAAPTDASSSR